MNFRILSSPSDLRDGDLIQINLKEIYIVTRFLLNLTLMGIITLAIYWLITSLAPSFGSFAIPVSLLLGITIGFYIYITIDNRL